MDHAFDESGCVACLRGPFSTIIENSPLSSKFPLADKLNCVFVRAPKSTAMKMVVFACLAWLALGGNWAGPSADNETQYQNLWQALGSNSAGSFDTDNETEYQYPRPLSQLFILLRELMMEVIRAIQVQRDSENAGRQLRRPREDQAQPQRNRACRPRLNPPGSIPGAASASHIDDVVGVHMNEDGSADIETTSILPSALGSAETLPPRAVCHIAICPDGLATSSNVEHIMMATDISRLQSSTQAALEGTARAIENVAPNQDLAQGTTRARADAPAGRSG